MSPLQCKGQLGRTAQKQGEERRDGHQAAHTGDVLVGDLPRCIADILLFVQHTVVPRIPGQTQAQKPGADRFRLG